MGTTAPACRAAVLTSCSTSGRRIRHGSEQLSVDQTGGRRPLKHGPVRPSTWAAGPAGRPSRQPCLSWSRLAEPIDMVGHQVYSATDAGRWSSRPLTPPVMTIPVPTWRNRSISSGDEPATHSPVSPAFRELSAACPQATMPAE